MMFVMCMSGTIGVNASQVPTADEIAEWEMESRARSNPIAEYEGMQTRASDRTLVASDVWLEYSGYGTYSFAKGYTDVKTSSGADAYHYTRAEMRRESLNYAIAQKTEYGYGYVEARTADVNEGIHMTDAYGRVFWG